MLVVDIIQSDHWEGQSGGRDCESGWHRSRNRCGSIGLRWGAAV